MAMADDRPPESSLERREPTVEDLRKLQPGELQKYNVIRVAHEIVAAIRTNCLK